MAKRIPHKEKPSFMCVGSDGACWLFGNIVAPKEYSIADSVCSCIGNRSPITATPVQIL